MKLEDLLKQARSMQAQLGETQGRDQIGSRDRRKRRRVG